MKKERNRALLAVVIVLRPRLFRLPFLLLENLLVPRRNHRIENDRNPAPVRPAAGRGDIALSGDRHPDEIGFRFRRKAAGKRLDVAETRRDPDKEEIHLPAEFPEK